MNNKDESKNSILLTKGEKIKNYILIIFIIQIIMTK